GIGGLARRVPRVEDPGAAVSESHLSPEGAEVCSPGREPGVTRQRDDAQPRRGDSLVWCRPSGAANSWLGSVTPGSRPGLHTSAPSGLNSYRRGAGDRGDVTGFPAST